MSLLIGADCVPTENNFSCFISGDTKKLIGTELCEIFKASEHIIMNLEVPLSDDLRPIDKCGPHLSAPTECINGYCAMGITLLSLANNHIMDQDESGLLSTIKTLKNKNIKFVGAGNNIKEAEKALIINSNGKKIGIYACAEHEFSVATDNRAGANPVDLIEIFDHIQELKSNCDWVIVLYHGGKELYRYPSPIQQKLFRKIAEKGADLVIAQHSHCIGCMEKYKGSTLVYGQGNFLFNFRSNEYWDTGMLIRVNDDFTIDYIPVSKTECGCKLASEQLSQNILKEFNYRSKEIEDPAVVNQKYNDYANHMINLYFDKMKGRPARYKRILKKIVGTSVYNLLLHNRYRKKNCLEIVNAIECEAHRELLITGLKTRIGQ